MRFALGFPFLLHFADAGHHFQRGVASPGGVAGFFERRAPEGHHGITNVFVERAVVIEYEAGHIREILVEEKGQVLGVEFLRNGGKAADVAEHHGNVGFSRLDELRINKQPANDFRAEVLAESGTHAALFFFLEQRAIKRNKQNVCTEGQSRDREVQPPAS